MSCFHVREEKNAVSRPKDEAGNDTGGPDIPAAFLVGNVLLVHPDLIPALKSQVPELFEDMPPARIPEFDVAQLPLPLSSKPIDFEPDFSARRILMNMI